MPSRKPSQAGHGTPAEASPTATRVLWRNVTGVQLEELLHGLLEAMGANRLTWRAGSATGVTASDGGRDLEAVFDKPGPDGELDRWRGWLECKGRSETVESPAVQHAVLDASARTDIDVLVVATNMPRPPRRNRGARFTLLNYQVAKTRRISSAAVTVSAATNRLTSDPHRPDMTF